MAIKPSKSVIGKKVLHYGKPWTVVGLLRGPQGDRAVLESHGLKEIVSVALVSLLDDNKEQKR